MCITISLLSFYLMLISNCYLHLWNVKLFRVLILFLGASPSLFYPLPPTTSVISTSSITSFSCSDFLQNFPKYFRAYAHASILLVESNSFHTHPVYKSGRYIGNYIPDMIIFSLFVSNFVLDRKAFYLFIKLFAYILSTIGMMVCPQHHCVPLKESIPRNIIEIKSRQSIAFSKVCFLYPFWNIR